MGSDNWGTATAVPRYQKTMNYQLYQGDCLNILPTIADESVDLTVTSPPYDNLRDYGKDFDAGAFDWRSIIKELYRVTAVGGVVVWVVADATVNGSETGTSFKQALWAMECRFNLHDTMIYYRENLPQNRNRYEQHFEYMFVFSVGSPKTFNAIRGRAKTAGQAQKIKSRHVGEKGARHEKAAGKTWRTGLTKVIGNIWKYQVGAGQGDAISHNHPATFPEQLAHDHIISWSNPGDVVLDPMMGSGTTGKMAIKNGRQFVGIELDANYFRIAEQRIKNAAGDFTTTDAEKKSGQMAIWDLGATNE